MFLVWNVDQALVTVSPARHLAPLVVRCDGRAAPRLGFYSSIKTLGFVGLGHCVKILYFIHTSLAFSVT
ncbi:hypothetical protein SBA1_1030041 [Candidatus Sulfotelmatobacter kueseliae]|uniref:Uncharacterized protein n=1 Tax=Candidatus Sulfotelmatobacter kueseliae TaxID=2042962 RepID=A0A2U3JXR8_9BACT|nr:hypothetical protein SBA1_1030041 [Candidatus Sulfotelmatobacter kueseliae]